MPNNSTPFFSSLFLRARGLCKSWARGIVTLTCLLALAPAALAQDTFLDIREVTSPSGITAWLVEDHALPVISLRFAFLESGSALDSEATQGLVQLLSNTMDEGAGDLPAKEFQKALLDQSITLTFGSGRDGFGGTLKTLSRHREKAFHLLHLALSAPRFDEEPVGRMKEANIARIRSNRTDPEWMAARLMNDVAFAGHPYALNSGGTVSTLGGLTPQDLKKFYKTHLTRDRLIVAAAGDITPKELTSLVERLFGHLPETGPDQTIPDTMVKGAGTITVHKQPIGQTVINIMMPAFDRDDPDYYALQVLNYIFGGAGFGSRLMEEVREKAGLSYGIYSSLRNYRHLDALAIHTSTKNETVKQSLSLIKREMRRLVNEPVSERELADAQSYLTGSMPLALSSTEAIAGLLLSLREDDLPIDYLDQYAKNIRAVTTEDVQRVAARILQQNAMTIVMVGNPVNIEPTHVIEELPNVE